MNPSATLQPETLPTLLRIYADAGLPLFVQGAPGIGKSAIVAEFARTRAAEQQRRFHALHAATQAENEAVAADPSQAFLFHDLRLSMINEVEIRGLHLMNGGTDHLRLTPPLWVKAFTQPDAAGVLFFDELNIAPDYVAAMAYQIIHDRVIADRKLAPGVVIVSAGNRRVDVPELVRELPGPLADRFGQVMMQSGTEAYLRYALGTGGRTSTGRAVEIPRRSAEDLATTRVRPELITVLKQNPGLLNTRPSTGKLTTERGFSRLSRLLDCAPKSLPADELSLLCLSAVGHDAATAVSGYLEYRNTLDLREFLKDPKTYAAKVSAKNRSALHALAEMSATAMPHEFKSADNKKLSKELMVAVDCLEDDAIALFVELLNARCGGPSGAVVFWRDCVLASGGTLPDSIRRAVRILADLRRD